MRVVAILLMASVLWFGSNCVSWAESEEPSTQSTDTQPAPDAPTTEQPKAEEQSSTPSVGPTESAAEDKNAKTKSKRRGGHKEKKSTKDK